MSRAFSRIDSIVGRRRAAPVLLVALSMAAALTLWANPVGANNLAGSCRGATLLPCSASAEQAYGETVLSRDGNDDEASVEAVLSHVLGAPIGVASIARGVTADSPSLDVTPDQVAGVQVFDWSYSGPSENLAYITVKASTAFAVFGVAGTTSGRIDVAELLGGHEISHISFWTIDASPVEPVRAKKLHGQDFLGNMRLAKIENGRVPCLHVETAELAFCKFGRNSGNWLESASGEYAVSSQAISLNGKPGGEYVIAARVNPDGSVPGLEPTGRDVAGTPTGYELPGGAFVETMLSSTNASGRPLLNYATREVCTSSFPHPDGAQLTRSPSPGVYCYIGQGAALNDFNGTERDWNNVYLTGFVYTHVAWSGGYEVYAAKRPATVNFPAPGFVRTDTPIVWRPVTNVRVAN